MSVGWSKFLCVRSRATNLKLVWLKKSCDIKRFKLEEYRRIFPLNVLSGIVTLFPTRERNEDLRKVENDSFLTALPESRK